MNLKRIIPLYAPSLIPFILIPVYIYDWLRYVKYSGTTGLSGKHKLLGRIVADYHVIEKGLTMPQTKAGFGKQRVEDLIRYINRFISVYGEGRNYCDGQVKHGISTILEYKEYHEKLGYSLDQDLSLKIDELSQKFNDINASQQSKLHRDEYFKYSKSDFFLFSNSRRSMRNYSAVDIKLDLIEQAIILARNAPSVCNRQGTRVHVFSDPATVQNMLKVQAGNRGFGHLANKVIAVTAELGSMHGVFERNQAFVDGGMWAMNLLYALHYYGIAACPLNCSNSPKKDKLLRHYGKIENSETFIMLISIGYAPDEFKIASSPRKPINEIATFH